MTSFVKSVLQFVHKGHHTSNDREIPRQKSSFAGSTKHVGAATTHKHLSVNFRWHSRVAAVFITDVYIFFGSRTGTAERFAMRLAADIAARGIRTVVRSLDAFDPFEFTDEERLVYTRAWLFVVSTHFAGAPPNAEKFQQWLRVASDRVGSTAMRRVVTTDMSPQRHSGPGARSKHTSTHPAQVLKGMQYAVFGVGDSTYLTFNAVAKFTDVRLHTIGATRLLALYLGDVSKDIETAFGEWEQSVFKLLPIVCCDGSLKSGLSLTRRDTTTDEMTSPAELAALEARQAEAGALSIQQGDRPLATSSCPNILTSDELEKLFASLQNRVLDLSDVPVRLRCRCRFIDEPESKAVAMGHLPLDSNAALTHRAKALLRAPGVRIQSIQRNHDASSPKNAIVQVKLELVDPDLTYDAADSFAYFPPNADDLVHHVASSLGFDLDAWFELYSDSDQGVAEFQQLPFPTPCTVRTALTEFLELLTISREFVRTASRFVAVSAEQEALEALSSTDGSASFHAQFVEQHKGIRDLIAMAPSMQLPFEVFVNFMTPIKPRLYSISCSPQAFPRVMDISVSLGPPDDDNRGKSVSYWKELLNSEQAGQGTMLRGFILSSSLKLPNDPAAPVIMIANGTGVGPMRALLQQREQARAMHQESLLVEDGSFTTLVFLGCTHSTSLLFGGEFEAWEQTGLIQRYMAFSAEPGHECQYVQHLVEMHMDTVARLMNQSPQACIFVCGSDLMTRAIRVLMQAYTEGTDSSWFSAIVSSGRYVEGTFT